MCVCMCVCFHTVCSLYVVTDGFSLIFYLVLQKIKLKLDDMLPLQFKRQKKKEKGSLREALMLAKSGPKCCLALLKRQSMGEPFRNYFLPQPKTSPKYMISVSEVGQALRLS